MKPLSFEEPGTVSPSSGTLCHALRAPVCPSSSLGTDAPSVLARSGEVLRDEELRDYGARGGAARTAISTRAGRLNAAKFKTDRGLS